MAERLPAPTRPIRSRRSALRASRSASRSSARTAARRSNIALAVAPLMHAAPDGTDTTIHGVSLLRIGSDGLITEHRDTWTELEGDHGVALVKEDAR